MASFESEAELSITVPQRELREARQTIENSLGDVSVGAGGGVRTDGGTGGSRNIARRINSIAGDTDRLVTLADERNTLLREIQEELEGGAGGGGGDDGDGLRLPRLRDIGLGLLGGAGGAAAGLAASQLQLPDLPQLEAPQAPTLQLPDLPELPVDIPDSLPLDIPDVIPVDAPDSIPLSDPQGLIQDIAQAASGAQGQAGPREDTLGRATSDPVEARRRARSGQQTGPSVPEGAPGARVPSDATAPDANLQAGAVAAGAAGVGAGFVAGARRLAGGASRASPAAGAFAISRGQFQNAEGNVRRLTGNGDGPATVREAVSEDPGGVENRSPRITIEKNVNVDPSGLEEMRRRLTDEIGREAADEAVSRVESRLNR